MHDNTWTQQEVAERVGVDQSTICRLLKSDPKRMGPAQQRVVEFLQSHAYSEGDETVKDGLIRAVESAWDGTPEHADAMIAVLGSMPVIRLKD